MILYDMAPRSYFLRIVMKLEKLAKSTMMMLL